MQRQVTFSLSPALFALHLTPALPWSPIFAFFWKRESSRSRTTSRALIAAASSGGGAPPSHLLPGAQTRQIVRRQEDRPRPRGHSADHRVPQAASLLRLRALFQVVDRALDVQADRAPRRLQGSEGAVAHPRLADSLAHGSGDGLHGKLSPFRIKFPELEGVGPATWGLPSGG